MPIWRWSSRCLLLGWLFVADGADAAPAAQSTVSRLLQEHAQQRLRSAKPLRGAIVLVRVKDGSILAAADYPAHSPKSESVLWSALSPSASLFKLVTTAALIEQAQIHPDHRVCSAGGEHRLFPEHLLAPTGGQIRCQPFSTIMATSRNAAYARLTAKYLTADTLSDFAERFGFNEPFNSGDSELGRFEAAAGALGLARSATGFVGSKLSVFGAANLGLTIATGGKRIPMTLSCSTETASLPPPERVLERRTAERLREMMESVVSRGTAYDAFHDEAGRPRLPQIRVAGKTGTLGSDEGTHSWFTGFAPSRAPQIVVAVLLENGAVWRTTAKAIAAEVMVDYFGLERAELARINSACGG